jgi:two-component system OmpR family sensor kinase
MATDSNHKGRIAFHKRLFIYLLLLFGAFLACFVAFQYGREKTYKISTLDDQLQLFNLRLADALSRGEDTTRYIEGNMIMDSLRVTMIDSAGQVIFDSRHDIPLSEFGNHLDRPEVAQALKVGHGYTLRRLSKSTDRYYFYSATLSDGNVIRSAVPYSLTLSEVLKVDSKFLWFMLAVALVISVAAFLMTRRLGENITRLNEFAVKAENGEPIDDIGQFPKDELGDISNHIVRMYTQQRQTKEALENEHNVVIKQEQEQERIKHELTQNINHELKTPVSSIQGYLETVIDNPDMDAVQRNDFIQKSYAQTQRLSQLLKDVATITRMDEASSIIDKEEVCLSDIIRDAFEEMRMQIEEKGIKVASSVPDGILMKGNQSLLSSVFRNLIDNSLAYSGCSCIYLTVRLEDDSDVINVNFADNGIGIPEEHLERIFERFYRVDKGRSRKLGGTGLGLSIVKNAVVLHGGKIVARPREGGGVEFVFTLKRDS